MFLFLHVTLRLNEHIHIQRTPSVQAGYNYLKAAYFEGMGVPEKLQTEKVHRFNTPSHIIRSNEQMKI
jgi:hypothetical protein